MKLKKLSLILTVALTGATLAACGNSGSSSNASSKSSSSATSSKKVAFKDSFKKDLLTTENFKLKITKSKVIKAGEKGNEDGTSSILAIWYDTTSTTKKKVTPSSAWITDFVVYQNTPENKDNKLIISKVPDTKFTNSQLEKIKKGKTVENVVGYILTDETTPVTLKATQGAGGRALGEKTFEIK